MSFRVEINPTVSNSALNQLFSDSWPQHEAVNFKPLLQHALVYVCGYHDRDLVGFAKLAWDGGTHGFLLDPTVSTKHRRKGLGKEMVEACKREGMSRGLEWIHVDYEPKLRGFYECCGFRNTEAGLINLKNIDTK